MKINKILGAVLLMAISVFMSCKGKSDADIQTAVAAKISGISGVTAETKDAVVTLSGEVQEESTKSSAENLTQSTEGVKSVVNNISVHPAPVITDTAQTVVTAPTDALQTGVNDILKDFPGATATVNDGVITVTGTLSSTKWKMLKMSLDALKPKKVDASGLSVK